MRARKALHISQRAYTLLKSLYHKEQMDPQVLEILLTMHYVPGSLL